jgi:hypothetical protein
MDVLTYVPISNNVVAMLWSAIYTSGVIKTFMLSVLFLECEDLLQVQEICQSEANSESDKFRMGHCLLMHAKKSIHTSNVCIKSSVKLRVPLFISHH